MDHPEIISRAVEISKSLVNTSITMVSSDLATSRSIGDLSRLAITLRNASALDERQINAISVAMKIDPLIVKGPMLDYMSKEQDWLQIKKEGKKIESIRVQIPPVEDVIQTLGQKWHDDNPSTIDSASLQTLSNLCRRPYELQALKSELNIHDEDFDCVVGYGISANYIGTFQSEETGNEVLWTPLYWNQNISNVEKYLSKQSAQNYVEIDDLHKNIKNSQGIPIDHLTSYNNTLLNQGIYCGFFPSIGIKNRNQVDYSYVFTASPQFDLNEKKDLFERARLIVACIRHGEYHAEWSKIKYPASILNALVTDTLSPHSYADIQYAILKIHNIINLEPAEVYGNTAYRTRWIHSPENDIAANIAKLMLEGSDATIASAEDLDAQKILVQGIFNYSAEQRRIASTKTVSAPNEFSRMLDSVRGGSAR